MKNLINSSQIILEENHNSLKNKTIASFTNSQIFQENQELMNSSNINSLLKESHH